MNFELHMILVETCVVAVWGLCWCNFRSKQLIYEPVSDQVSWRQVLDFQNIPSKIPSHSKYTLNYKDCSDSSWSCLVLSTPLLHIRSPGDPLWADPLVRPAPALHATQAGGSAAWQLVSWKSGRIGNGGILMWNMLARYLLSLIVSVASANIRKRTTLAGLAPALRQGPWNVLITMKNSKHCYRKYRNYTYKHQIIKENHNK